MVVAETGLRVLTARRVTARSQSSRHVRFSTQMEFDFCLVRFVHDHLADPSRPSQIHEP